MRLLLAGEVLHQVPTAAQRNRPAYPDNDTTEQEWHRERGPDLGRGEGKPERDRRKRQVSTLLLTELAQTRRSLIN